MAQKYIVQLVEDISGESLEQGEGETVTSRSSRWSSDPAIDWIAAVGRAAALQTEARVDSGQNGRPHGR